jgi:hypothetical protein
MSLSILNAFRKLSRISNFLSNSTSIVLSLIEGERQVNIYTDFKILDCMMHMSYDWLRLLFMLSLNDEYKSNLFAANAANNKGTNHTCILFHLGSLTEPQKQSIMSFVLCRFDVVPETCYLRLFESNF